MLIFTKKVNAKMNNSTNDYYNQNAEKYAQSTFNLDMKTAYDKFLSNIPKEGHILDVGCGSGRDSLYFLNQGYKLTAIDSSEELAKIASSNINQKVNVLPIQDLKEKNVYDGVWCMASLLHLNKGDLKRALKNIDEALKPSGVFFASFKIGEGESLDNNGRFFSYTNAQEFKKIADELNIFKNIRFTQSGDGLGRNDTVWLNVVAESNKPELTVSNKKKNKLKM